MFMPPLKLAINDRGIVSAKKRGDAIVLTVTEGRFGRTKIKTVYSRSPWMPELCEALGIDNPFIEKTCADCGVRRREPCRGVRSDKCWYAR